VTAVNPKIGFEVDQGRRHSLPYQLRENRALVAKRDLLALDLVRVHTRFREVGDTKMTVLDLQYGPRSLDSLRGAVELTPIAYYAGRARARKRLKLPIALDFTH
jgi:hypothetical protein